MISKLAESSRINIIQIRKGKKRRVRVFCRWRSNLMLNVIMNSWIIAGVHLFVYILSDLMEVVAGRRK